MLHILGYDHEDAAEGRRMKAREDEVLGRLGYAGRYEHGH
jgi:ssRNA-specific RNase YbeY (16S rRNA maturation enzyme)